MSRIPQYPPPRRPQAAGPSQPEYVPPSPTTVRPLQINRPPTRPTTPSSKTPNAGPSTSPSNGPIRPQRSGLRSRQVSEYSASDRLSMDSYRESRDSTGLSRSDPSQPPPRPPRGIITGTSRPPNGKLETNLSPISPSDESEVSPAAVAIAAFQNAIARRRGKVDRDYVDEEYDRQREKEMAIQMDRQKRIRDKVPGRKATKPRAGDIDAVLDEIKDEWEIVTNTDFNSVDLALQLLDDSSLGKDMRSFRQTKDMLSRALKGSVDKHNQAFAASLPHHSALMSRLQTVQSSIREARTALQESKDLLGGKRGDLVQLWTRNQTLEEMLRILDEIEHLRSVPDVLESLISEKRLLQAAVMLVRSLKLINKQDMLEIGALSDLRAYLTSQETALRDILVDELHSHLYLRSFWCDSRWAVYVPNQQAFASVEFDEEGLGGKDQTTTSAGTRSLSRSSRLSRYLDDLNLRPNEAPVDLNDNNYRNSMSANGLQASSSMGFGLSNLPSQSSLLNVPGPSTIAVTSSSNPPQSSRNPESDSFGYVETLLESLAVLGKLGHSLDVAAQKLPQEIYSLIETTLDEVSERAEYGRRASVIGLVGPSGHLGRDSVYFQTATGAAEALVTSRMVGAAFTSGSGVTGGALLPPTSLRLAALEMSTKRIDQEIMKDFFWTLYSKLDAVAQGLRVVYEVSNRIGSRRDFKDSSGTKPGSLFPLAEIWMPIQTEIRTLLNDYITDEEQGVVSGRNPISSINEVLREGRYFRDKSKPVFRFADTDIKLATKTLKVHEDELTKVLKDTVPGLVQGTSDNTLQATLSAVGSDDRLLGPGQHHRLLVRPDAFHVSVLFQPTLVFMDRLSEILPSGHETSRAANVLLDEFVLKVYLPQLEDKVSELFHNAVTSSDAFQPDPISKRLSSQPLVKAAVQLLALINSLCAMLRTTPFHRESYSRLILTVIVQFYQRCSDRFQDLVTLKSADEVEEPRIALAAEWAQRSEVVACLAELFAIILDANSTSRNQLCKQECHLEGQLLGERTISKEELVSSTRNLSSLASLYHSVTWFAEELNKLKAISPGATSPTYPQKLEPLSAMTPWTPFAPELVAQADEPLTLPLSAAMAMRFQALQKTYEQLSESILHTIRIDIRCRVMHHLDLALRHGNYRIDREASEPDPHVVDLNAELATCDDFISSTLPEKERRFVFEGLSHLMQGLLIGNGKFIHGANTNGIKKMARNILALQQNIRTIGMENRQVEFERVKRYYSLFNLTPPDLLDAIRQKQEFSFDEYKIILDLRCGVDPTRGEKGVVQATDRNYNMYVIELHGLELENSADDIQ